VLYDDGRVACDDTALIIRRYYPWGAKRVPYASIRSFRRRQLGPVRGKWRIWGSGDLKHWWNFDWGRRHKTSGLEIDLGRWIIPTITPDDVDAVERVLGEKSG
jgi:hypothetical protein